MTNIVVLSDSHVRAGSPRRLPDLAYEALEKADLVLHAGDVVSGDFLHELGGFAPVRAVLGNNDVDLVGVLPLASSGERDSSLSGGVVWVGGLGWMRWRWLRRSRRLSTG
jgi:predicted phosphodiesterase